MLRASRRFVALVVGILVAIVGGLVGYLLLPPRQSGDVAVPARTASPEQVVTTYLDALNAHDCGTAEAVMTNGAKDSAKLWCDEVARLTDVRVHQHFKERPNVTGHSAPEEVVGVPVAFILEWRPLHDDGSMAEGATTWGYWLVRDSPHSPWRIFDQGTG